jgi:tRNA pseudouridine38-40 synthase
MRQTDADAVLKIVLSYDGSGYAGSQRQSNRRSVQAELERALAKLADRETPVALAGRTDEGVHAAGQVASAADVRPKWGGQQYVSGLNAYLPGDCAVLEVTKEPPSFHARYDAIWREYRYRIWSGARQPLVRTVTWQRRGALDAEAMRNGIAKLVGNHDFASFAGGGDGVPWSERRNTERGTTRTVLMGDVRSISPWWGDANGQLIEVRIAADGFLPRMVRTIAGVMVEIGQQRKDADWIDTLLAERDRRLAGETAPARGLTLWRVGYAGDLPDGMASSNK